MNCQSGDFCRVIAGEFRDRFLTVTELHQDPKHGPHWSYEGEYFKCKDGSKQLTFFDHRLRPIRDPGDDAVDETLNIIEVPTTETA